MKLFYTLAFFGFGILCIPSSAYSNETSATSSMALSKARPTKDFKLEIDFSLEALAFKESQDESQIVQFSPLTKGDFSITKEFGVKGMAQLNLTNGRSQSRFQNPNFNLVNILEIVSYFEPSQYFQFSVGVINQDHYDNRMLIADRGFPGVLLKSDLGNKQLILTPKVQYAIPTSTSFEDDRKEAESLPTFSTFGLEANLAALPWLILNANVNKFQFSDIPSVVAFESSRLGNSVIGTSPSETYFRYQFAGLSQSYNIKFKYHERVEQNFKFGIVDNSEAPQDRQRSQWVGSDITLDFQKFSITPEYALFFAESDSVPALYSAFELGRSNRNGQFYGLNVNLKDLGVSIRSNFVDSRLIEDRPLQADMQIFNIALEFNYVAL